MADAWAALTRWRQRHGRRVVGYGFNSNGRYAQDGLLRERFIPRLMHAKAQALINDAGDNLDPHRIWACMMANEKPGGPGERPVAGGTSVTYHADIDFPGVAALAGPFLRGELERLGDKIVESMPRAIEGR